MLKYHIQTVEVGSGGAASVTFNNISQEYSDLELVYSAKNSGTDTNNGKYGLLGIRFNNSDTGYTAIELSGNGTGGIQSLNRTTTTIDSLTYGRFNNGIKNSYNGNLAFENARIYICNYTSSQSKSYSADTVGEQNASDAIANISAGLWDDTNPIKSITLATADFSQYSSVSLYGIKHGSSGEVEVASGGEISYSGGYTIHTFESSGTFVAGRDLDVEYLVVAGGGSGGNSYGGGGGSGGYRSSVSGESSGGGASAESALSLTSNTEYVVTVGAGGAPGSTSGSNGLRGSDSVFGSITATGGGGGNGEPARTTPSTTQSGGSGGGGQGYDGTDSGGSGTTNQGYAGGSGGGTSGQANNGAGGGGGASGVGQNGSNLFSPTAGYGDGGYGGDGISSSITGFAVTRGGGGGGAAHPSGGTIGQGGAGGGGDASISSNAGNGVANTGGGGGGVTSTGYSAGSGGSGVVIIRYLTP